MILEKSIWYALTYYRLSKDDCMDKESGNTSDQQENQRYSGKESNSIMNQRKLIQEFISGSEDIIFVKEFFDDGYSGTNFERTCFQKMMLVVKNGNVKTIVIKDLSRLGRNYLDVGYYLEYIFPAYDVRVIAINDQFDSNALNDGSARMEVAIRNLINEHYSRDISKKISSAARVKKMSGEYVYGAVPFGYQKGRVKNTIVIDPVAAKTVKYVFSLALNGLSYTAIAKRLNEEKVTTPSVYLAEHGGRKNYKVSPYWSYESVRNLLTNHIYTGDTESYKSHVTRIGSNQVKQIPMSERVVIKNTHEAIISLEDFEKAREVVKVTKAKSSSKGKNSILTGYLECGCCGGKLTKGKASNHNFLCVNARYRPDSGCRTVRVEEKRIQEILLNAVRVQVSLLEEQDSKLKARLSQRENQVLVLQKELTQKVSEEKKCRHQKIRIYEDFVEGKLSREQYLQEKAGIAEHLEELSAQIAVTKKTIEELSVKGQEDNAEITENRRFEEYRGQELSETMLSALIRKVIIAPDGGVEICWRYRDELLGENQTAAR